MRSLSGGAEGDRTPDLRIANAALCQTELLPHSRNADDMLAVLVSSPEVRMRIQSQVSGFKLQEFKLGPRSNLVNFGMVRAAIVWKRDPLDWNATTLAGNE